MEQAGVALIAQGGDTYITTITQATKATNTFVDATDKGSGKVSAAGQIMTGALRKVGEFTVTALAQAAKATVAFVGDSVDLAGDFEQGMLSFQAVAGKDVDTKGLEKFKDLFLSLGKELPVSTSEVQQAAIEMIKGGIDPAIVAAGGLKQNIQFAAAAMEGDLVAAAEVSSKILGGWADANATAQQKAEFLTHATDQLTKAANASSVDVRELSLGIFNAQGIAKTAGVSFDDLTTTLAALSPRFASSSEAGNSLKNVIARLQPTTDAATAAMQGLGLITADGTNKFYDAQGSFIGFEQASQLLQDSLKGLTDQQKQAVLQTIFGNDAMNAASGLAELGAAGYQHMADALANANGVAENAALKQQGFNTALENAKGSVEALQITIGSALLPILTDLLNDVVAPAVNTFTDLASAIFGDADAFDKLSPTMKDVAKTAQQLADDFLAGVAAAEDVARQIKDLIGSFNRAGDAGDDLGKVVNDLSGIWDKALGVVQDVGDGYMEIAQSVLPIVSQFWEEHGTEITTFLQTAYDKIMNIINAALDLYDAVVPQVLHNVAGWIADHAEGIQAVLGGAWDVISGVIDAALTLIEGTIKIALDLINGDWSKAWADLQQMSATFVTDIAQVIEGGLNIIAGFFNTSLQGIVDVWQHNWDMLVQIATQTDWVQVGTDVVNGIISGIENSAGSLFNTLRNLASDALAAAKDALGIESPSKQFAAIGQYSIIGLIDGLGDMLPSLVSTATKIANDMMAALTKNIEKGQAELQKQLDSVVAAINSVASQIQDSIADAFGATASIDRQMASNLSKLGKMADDFYKEAATRQLQAASDQAKAFADPAVGAEYYKMRSKQIFEFMDLQKQINAETNADTKASLQQQQRLILNAQQAEIDQFNAQQVNNTSPSQDIAAQLSDILAHIPAGILDNPVIAQIFALLDQLRNIPARAGGGPVDAGMPYWVGESGPELFWPAMDGMVSPAATSQQMAARANQTTYNGQVGNTFNMPIYTNQSPQVVQQSWAVMQASMP